MKAQKTISYNKTGEGMLKMAYQKVKVKRRNNKVITKTTNATTNTDLRNRKFTGSGTKTRTVTRNGVVTRSKTRNLGLRKLAKLI